MDVEYQRSLDLLRQLAQRDLLAAWSGLKKYPFRVMDATLREAFAKTAVEYGEQAALLAADYLFMQRSLDESLAGLAFPELADPIKHEQAVKSYEWAMQKLKEAGGEDPELEAVAKEKLKGITSRIITAQANDTVMKATQDAGTKFARVPEPGACAFCLMLASRGAVYVNKTVLETAVTRGNSDPAREIARYHDHCKCVGIEVKTDAELPRINKDLQAEWKAFRELASTEGIQNPRKKSERLKLNTEGSIDWVRGRDLWRKHIQNRRHLAGADRRFPKVPGVKTPKYKGKGTRFVNGVEEQLPDLHHLAGHVIFGWRSDPTFGKGKRAYGLDERGIPNPYPLDKTKGGHTSESLELDKTRFPADWSDQKILDTIRDILEDEKVSVAIREDNARLLEKDVDGVLVRVLYWETLGKTHSVTGYPIMDGRKNGVSRVRANGTIKKNGGG